MGAPLGAADLFFFSFTSQGGELLPLIDPPVQPESSHQSRSSSTGGCFAPCSVGYLTVAAAMAATAPSLVPVLSPSLSPAMAPTMPASPKSSDRKVVLLTMADEVELEEKHVLAVDDSSVDKAVIVKTLRSSNYRGKHQSICKEMFVLSFFGQ